MARGLVPNVQFLASAARALELEPAGPLNRRSSDSSPAAKNEGHLMETESRAEPGTGEDEERLRNESRPLFRPR